MNSDQALSLQSRLLSLAPSIGGTWTPARAAVGDISISASSDAANGGKIIAELTICDISGERLLILAKTVEFIGSNEIARYTSASFRVSAVLPLADLEFDTIREAFEKARAQVQASQLAALAKIETARAAEASAALH